MNLYFFSLVLDRPDRGDFGGCAVIKAKTVDQAWDLLAADRKGGFTDAQRDYRLEGFVSNGDGQPRKLAFITRVGKLEVASVS